MKRILLSTFLAAAAVLPSFAAKPNVLTLKESITDNSIVFPETFEKDTRKLLEGWYLKNYTATDDRYSRVGDVEVSDATIKARLAAMPTIIEMPFNQIVRDYIKRYTKQGREQVAAILGLSLYYTPIFEQALEQAGLPLELKYLPVIESALDPNAVSRSGAAGLWQLMIGTGKGLGLEINSLVDERRDPYLSSEKAASYLKDLYETYGDWSLAIAAYNCGPGAVNKALRRAGGDPKSHDFWSIYKYLSPETRGYVPMFIAANYVMTYHKDHNISPVLATKPLVTDTVAVYNRLHFNQISEVLNIPVEELRILNPQFRADVIPAATDRPYFLILPSQQVHAYIVSEKDIFAHEAEKYAHRETVEPGDNAPAVAYEPASSENDAAAEQEVAMVKRQAASANGKDALTHKVTSGETLASIAQQYGVKEGQIKEWNNLRRNAVRTGQQLKIYIPGQETAAVSKNGSKKDRKADTPKATKQEAQKETKKEVVKETKQQPAAQTVEPVQAKAKKSKKEQAAEAQQLAQEQTKQSGKKSKTQQQAAAKKDNKKSKQKQKQQQPVQVEVKSGDNLSHIAKRNGTTVEELRKANPNLKGDMLHPGDKLNVPTKQQATGKSKKGKQQQTQTKKKSKKRR
ncbi:MAG: LysM peptidoglycan-binding domain-containing protein [Prevotella sp.]|nr:LysM peptidoglycan-binding domain-containing protein [Prevotella sp.]MCM1075005.1 LysM peptidoglycan-binding domain-containing protein [Ruminococcus sp.]